MSNYVPHSYPSKREGKRDKWEGRLAQRIKAGADAAEIEKAAEKVRNAQLSLCKCRHHLASLEINANPCEARRDELARTLKRIEADTVEWESKPVSDIIALYRSQENKST